MDLLDLIRDYGQAKYSQGIAEQRNANESEILRHATKADELLATIDRRIDLVRHVMIASMLVGDILDGKE